MAVNYAAGNYFRDRMTEDELRNQELERRRQEKEHSGNWWKRGLGRGAMGALSGAIAGIPGGPAGMAVGAGAGLVGGFGGEAINHYGFKDKNPEIAGNVAALAAMGGGVAGSKAFGKPAVGALGSGAPVSDAYTKELQLGKSMPNLANPANLSAPAMPGSAVMGNAQAATLGGPAQSAYAGPSAAFADPGNLASAGLENMTDLERQEFLRYLELMQTRA